MFWSVKLEETSGASWFHGGIGLDHFNLELAVVCVRSVWFHGGIACVHPLFNLSSGTPQQQSVKVRGAKFKTPF
jgi:hypothetical protein